MKPYVAYRVTKNNSEGSLLVGNIISFTADEQCIDVWASADNDSCDSKGITNPDTIDFECEEADDYIIYVSKYSMECLHA